MSVKYTIKDTVRGIRREANTFNYISILLGVLVAVFVWGANGSAEGFYAENKLSYWIASYLFFFIGTFTPLARAKYLPYGKRFYWGGFGILAFAFFWLAKVIWSTLTAGTDTISQQETDMIGYSVAAALVILGWFVQHQLTRQHNKTGHSLNVLLQMRVSEEFQQQTRLANQYYPSRNRTPIPKGDIDLYHNTNTDFSDVENLTAEQKKLKSISSHSYLLNYYEFLAFGIKSGTLDEELLFQTLGGVVTGHVERAQAVINYARTKSLKTFVNLVELNERWKERREFDSEQLELKSKAK